MWKMESKLLMFVILKSGNFDKRKHKSKACIAYIGTFFQNLMSTSLYKVN